MLLYGMSTGSSLPWTAGYGCRKAPVGCWISRSLSRKGFPFLVWDARHIPQRFCEPFLWLPEIQQHFASLRDSGVHRFPCQVPVSGGLSSSALPACSCCCIRLNPCLPWAGCQTNNPCCLEAAFEKFPFFHGQRCTVCGPVASPWQLLNALLKQGDCVNSMKKEHIASNAQKKAGLRELQTHKQCFPCGK